MRLTEKNLDLGLFSVNLFRVSDATKTGRNGTDDDWPSMTELHAEGDRELWYADGNEGQPTAWRFPLWVFWRRHPAGARYALVCPAVAPYSKQQLHLQAIFEVHTFLPRTDRWLIRAEFVEALLKKAPGVHPRKYYIWGDVKAEPIEIPPTLLPDVKQPEHLGKKFGHERKLVSRIAEARGIPTTVVKTVLDGLNEVAAEHMIQEGKPIDLGFVKLVAVPFRANWKEIICYRLGKLRLTKHLVAGDKEKLRDGFPEMLCSPLNIALRRAPRGDTKRIDHTIEALPSKEFEKRVNAIEYSRKAPGGMNYVRIFEKRVEQLYDQIIEILQAYLKKVDLPFARVRESGSTGIFGFVETLGHHARAHGANFRRLPVHIIPPRTGFTAHADQSDLCLLRPPSPEMSKLPDLQQEENDVRDGAEPGVVEELDDRPGGSGGVLVLDAGQGKAAGQPLLSNGEVGDGQPSWVDIKGD